MNPELRQAVLSRNYSTLRLWEVSWDEFIDDKSIASVTDIHSFYFYAKLSGIGRWSGLVDSNRVALRLLASVEEAVTEAGFMNIPAIETVIEPEGVVFRYTDSDYGFDLIFRGSGSVEVRRSGSSLETFHRWYTGFMPSIPAILLKAMSALDRELNRNLKDDDESADGNLSGEPISSRETVRILAAGFSFNVVCTGFTQNGVACNNLDVMRKNVAVRLPDTSGVMSAEESPIDLDSYGRMDYKVSLRHPSEPTVTQFLTVEAPSNANWKALFFNFDFAGENFRSREVGREALNPELFLSSAICSDAYISFFRDIGLKGFLRSVTDSFDYRTTASSLL